MNRSRDLPISFRTRSGTMIVKVLCKTFGAFDVGAVSKHTFKLIQSGCKRFIFDLGCVEYLSTAAVALLDVTRQKLAEVGGDLKLLNPSERVLEILRLYRFYDKFQEHIIKSGALCVKLFSKENSK